MPHSKQGGYDCFMLYLTTRDPEGVMFDAPNQGNRLLNESCAPKKKDRLHPHLVILI